MSVSQLRGVVPRSELVGDQGRAEDLANYKVCEPGDIVLNRMSAYNGALGVARERGVVSPDYLVMKPRETVLSEFIAAWLKTPIGVFEMTSRLRGIGSVDAVQVRTPRVNESDLRTIPLSMPPAKEQRAIADYLDHETARIDALIDEQQRLIEMLRERRIGVVRAGVSGLLFGGTSRPSDAWFGVLPDAWTSTRIRYDFSVVLGKMLNASKASSADVIEAPYLAAGSIQPETLLLDESKKVAFEPTELRVLDLRAGDVIVVEGGAGYGRSHYLRCDLPGWGFQNHVARLRPSSGRARGLFATYCLKACLASGYIEANNRTATLPSLSRDVLGSIQIPLPPLDDQRRIETYLDEQTTKIDALMAEAERCIELAGERRTALITAAVTGQIDVRAVA